MPIETTCSSCGTEYTLPDSKRGKSVRCGECGSSVLVEEVEERIQERAPRLKSKAGSRAVTATPRVGRETDEESAEERKAPQRAKKKPKKKGTSLAVILGCVAAGLFVLGGVGGLGYYLATRPRDKAPAPAPAAQGGGAGGGFGTVQAVRTAATRTVVLNDLHNLKISIESASLANGTMPSAKEITDAMQREAGSRQTHMLLLPGPDGGRPAITLTGTRSREHIWAYSTSPQSVGGEHLVLTSSGVERIAAALLRQQLQQQGLPLPPS